MKPERWRRITDLFHAALARPAAERAQFLRDACPADEALRAEVETMLAAHGSDRDDVPPVALPDEAAEADLVGVIGPYTVEGLIGAGGMGRVYRGHDTRIGRPVAIKLLPAAYAADADRLRRFEQEARASGALSHPNVLTLYDVGTADGRPYLVTELVDGETLRDRVTRGPLSPARACDIASAIARGLAAAHAKGIVHRDLKPENVMVTRDGRVKILDFGIAKLQAPGDAAAATSPRQTDPGVMVGTAGYMAPEQARSVETDGRADVFALGAILFELLTGRRAFDAESRIDTLHASLHDDPIAGVETGHWPPALVRIVRRCLEKGPEARFQSAGDLAFALETITVIGHQAPEPGSRLATRGGAVYAAGATAALGAGLLGWALWVPTPAVTSPVRDLARFELRVPPQLRFAGVPAITRDGTAIVYAATTGLTEASRLHVRRIDQLTTTPLPGTEGAIRPFISPDGTSVGFWVGDRLKRTRLDATASPVDVSAADSGLGGTWMPDGTIIFVSRAGLQQVAADGGTARPLGVSDPGAVHYHWPAPLPGGRALLFTVHSGRTQFRIDVLNLSTGARRTVIEDGFEAQYVPTGHLVFGRGSALVATPFDVTRLEVTGPAVQLVDGVATASLEGAGRYALSDNGTLVFTPAAPPPRRTLAWVDRTGAETPLPLEPRAFSTPRLSPDGRQIAVVIEEGDARQIWIHHLDRGTFSRVSGDGSAWAPVWSRDGSQIFYVSEQQGRWSLVRLQVDSQAAPEVLLTNDRDELGLGSVSVDGPTLIYTVIAADGVAAFHALDLATGRSSALADLAMTVAMPAVSPNGRWLGFTGWSTARPSIFVRGIDAAGPVRPLVEAAGYTVWNASGDRLYFRSRRGATGAPTDGVFELPFDSARGVATGPERQLFRKTFTDWLGVPGFDVAADGRFLLVLSDERESIPPDMQVILHVDDVLRRRQTP
jgi:serine/threonine-protein kinase